MSPYPNDPYQAYGSGYGQGMPRFQLPRLTRAVKVFLIINFGVFLLQMFYYLGAKQGFAEYLGVSLAAIADSPILGVFKLFTYQFVHDVYPGHILGNMLVLYFFGTMLEERIGSRRLTQLYLSAGLIGGLVWLLFSAFTGNTEVPLVGASGATYGILTLAALLMPRANIIFFIVIVPLWVLAAILGLIAVYSTVIDLANPGGQVAHAAHLGGIVCALAWWKMGPAMARWLQQQEARAARHDAEMKRAEAKKLDELLAKINRVGMGGLSSSERKFLARYSKNKKE